MKKKKKKKIKQISPVRNTQGINQISIVRLYSAVVWCVDRGDAKLLTFTLAKPVMQKYFWTLCVVALFIIQVAKREISLTGWMFRGKEEKHIHGLFIFSSDKIADSSAVWGINHWIKQVTSLKILLTIVIGEFAVMLDVSFMRRYFSVISFLGWDEFFKLKLLIGMWDLF